MKFKLPIRNHRYILAEDFVFSACHAYPNSVFFTANVNKEFVISKSSTSYGDTKFKLPKGAKASVNTLNFNGNRNMEVLLTFTSPNSVLGTLWVSIETFLEIPFKEFDETPIVFREDLRSKE